MHTAVIQNLPGDLISECPHDVITSKRVYSATRRQSPEITTTRRRCRRRVLAAAIMSSCASARFEEVALLCVVECVAALRLNDPLPRVCVNDSVFVSTRLSRMQTRPNDVHTQQTRRIWLHRGGWFCVFPLGGEGSKFLNITHREANIR